MRALRTCILWLALLGLAGGVVAQTNGECSLEITSPEAGETWVVGQGSVLRWSGAGDCPNLFTRIELLGRSVGMGGKVIHTLTNVVNNGWLYFTPTADFLGYPEYIFRFWGVLPGGDGSEHLLAISGAFFISKNNLPSLIVDPQRLRFVLPVGDHSRSETVYLVANHGTVTWEAVSPKGWLTAEPTGGSIESGAKAQAVTVTVSALTIGTGEHTETLAFIDPTREETLATVTVEVTVISAYEGDPLLELDKRRLAFTHRLEDAYTPQKLTLSNTGTAPVGWAASTGSAWLSLSPSRGILEAGGSTSIVVLVSRLFTAPGSHRTTIRFRGSDGTDLVVLVGVNLTRPAAAGTWPPSGKPRSTLPVAASASGAYGSFWSTDAAILPSGPTAQAAHARTKLEALRSLDGTSLLTERRLADLRADLETRAAGAVPRGTNQFIWGALGQKVRSAEAVITDTALPDGTPTLFADVLGSYFGLTETSRFIQVAGDLADDVLLVSRTYSTDPDGETYGQSVQAPTEAEIIGPGGGTAYVPGLRHAPDDGISKGWRSNLFVTEIGGTATPVTARLYDVHGNPTGNSLSRTLEPFSQWQIVNTASAFDSSVPWTYAEVVSAGGGQVVVLGSVVDNNSNDPTTVNGFVATPAARATEDLFLPAIVRVAGNYGTNWRSDITLLNASASSLNIKAQFIPMAGTAAGVQETWIPLGPRAMIVHQDLVYTLFGLDAGAGTLRLTGVDPGSFFAFNRIYNLAGDGSTFGQGTGAYRLGDAVGLKTGTLYTLGLERSPKYRTNVGVVEVAGSPATVLFTVVAPTGEARSYLAALNPGQWFQADDIIRDKAGFAGDFANAWVMIDVVEGAGRVLGYGSIVDNDSSDGTYIKLDVR